LSYEVDNTHAAFTKFVDNSMWETVRPIIVYGILDARKEKLIIARFMSDMLFLACRFLARSLWIESDKLIAYEITRFCPICF